MGVAIINTWQGQLTAPQVSQLRAFVTALAPDANVANLRGVTCFRDGASVSYTIVGEKPLAQLSDLPLGTVEILSKV